MTDLLSKRIQRSIDLKQATWNRLLQQNLFRVSNEDSEYIPLTMRITDKQDGSEFGVEEMLRHIHDGPVALVGSPGVGKSTLLLKFAIHLADIFNSDKHEAALIPVHISAGANANYKKDKSGDILSWIRLQIPDEDREELMLDGRLCIIIDGLNESSEIDVDSLLKDIYNLYDRFPFCKYIVSCRGLEFPRKWDRLYDLFSVNPVTNEQIEEKFRSELVSCEDGERFFRELTKSHGGFMLELCRNPLLLTLVIRIIKSKLQDNPNYSLLSLRNKGDIYKQFCECLNTYRTEMLDYTSWGITPAVEKGILSTMAYYMQSTKSVYIRWNDDANSTPFMNPAYSVDSLIRKMNYDNDELRNYVNVAKEQNGAYSWYQRTSTELKKSSYFKLHDTFSNGKKYSFASFIHQSFGEYFAGLYIREHMRNKNVLYYLLGPRFEQKRNWDAIEFATCLDESFFLLDEIINYATSFRDADALLLASRCLLLNANDTNSSEKAFCDIVDNCCIWLLDAFKNWSIAYNYELIYAASRLLQYVSEDFPARLRVDIKYFSDKYTGNYDAVSLPFFFERQRLMEIASDPDEPYEYRADALYTLGTREWDEENVVLVRDYLFDLLSKSNEDIKEQAMKAIKSLLETASKSSECKSLPAFTDEMFQILLSIIRDKRESARVRTYALNTLAETGNLKTIDAFMDYLRDKDNPYRDSASWSLQTLVLRSCGDRSQMADFYYECLINESSDITGIYSKGNLVYTLSKIGDKTLVARLKEWLNSESEPYVIEDGINAIGELAGCSDLEYIQQYTKSDDPVIRAKAYKSVCKIVGYDGLSDDELDRIYADKYSIVQRAICRPKDVSEDRMLASIQLDTLLNLSNQNADNDMARRDENKMAQFQDKVTIYQYNEFHGPGTAEPPVIPPPAFTPDEFANALREVVDDGNKSEQTYLRRAIQSAEAKNENAFLDALKKVIEVGGNILAKITSEALIAYLRANNLFPTP